MLIWMILCQAPLWEVKLDIFTPLTNQYALTSADGPSYVLHPTSGHIHRIDEAGTLLSIFGEENGDFNAKSPFSFYEAGPYIYVSSPRGLRQFDREGRFIKMFNTDISGQRHRVANGGWVFQKKTNLSGTISAELVWVTDAHPTKELLLAKSATRSLPTHSPNGTAIIHYNPAPDRFLWALNRPRTHLAYRTPNVSHLTILDLTTGQEKTIRPAFPLVPLSPKWAQARFATWKKDRQATHSFNLFHGKYFPSISALIWRSDGYLGIHQQGEEQGRFLRSRYVDITGRPASMLPLPAHLDKFVLHIDRARRLAYVIGYDGEVVSLSCRPLTGLHMYLKSVQHHFLEAR